VRIATHLNDLSKLAGVRSEFYLEDRDCSPAGVDIASN
jgi:hypothetical protein